MDNRTALFRLVVTSLVLIFGTVLIFSRVRAAPGTSLAEEYVIAVDDSDSTNEEVPKETEVTANDKLKNADIRMSVVSEPSHGSTVAKNKFVVIYTPDLNFSGSDSYRYRICSNHDGSCSEATVFFTVFPVNDPPRAVDDIASTDEDTPVTIVVLNNDSDVDGDTLSLADFDRSSQQGGIIERDGSTEALIYTPPANFSGTDAFNYTVSDGTAKSSAQVKVTVNPKNDAPVAANDSYSVDKNTTLDVPAWAGILVNDSDPDGDDLKTVLVSAPTKGSLSLHPDGGFVYEPGSGYVGQDSFTYRASDGEFHSNVASVTIQVLETNTPPLATGDSYTVQANSSLTVPAPGVLGNDSAPDGGSLTAILDDQTEHGSLVLNSDGSFTYTPEADFIGEDKFVYRASDGDLESNEAEVLINVAQNDVQQPTVTWSSPVGDEDVYQVVDEIVVLEVQASDNQGVARVLFTRWDSLSEKHMTLGNLTSPPYRLELDTRTINLGWNQINVRAYDTAGNPSDVGYIWLFKVTRFFLPVILD